MSYRSSQRGLTLIELLITIVILSFTVALMSGAFVQIAQMLRVSSEQNNGFLDRWNQSRALYEMVGNITIDPTLSVPFSGSEGHMDMVTLSMPDGPQGVARQARVSLIVSEEDEDTTELILDAPAIGAKQPSMLLARIPGKLEFRYVDHKGVDHGQWPPSGVAVYRALPSVVLLRSTDGRRLLVRAAAYEGYLDPKNNAMAQAFGVTN